MIEAIEERTRVADRSERKIAGILISADLLSSETSGYRGCLDGFEPESGLLGWAVNLHDPAEPLTLRFNVDGMSAFEVTTCHPRPDVSTTIGRPDIQPGFCIPKGELSRLAHLVAMRPKAEFSVEIGTTSLLLPHADTLPPLQTVVSSLVETRRPHCREAYSLERLAQTKQDAEPLTFLPLRPFDETRIGFVEVICTDDQNDDLTWIIGWSFGGDFQDAPVVLVDGRKFHGAVIACKYPRLDLPPGGAGFVGVLYSKWRARQTSRPIIYIGRSVQYHVVSVPELPRLSRKDVLSYIEPHLGEHQSSWADLHSILTSRDTWMRRSDGQLEVKAGIDQLVLVPQLGCFVSGWVLSYAKIIDGFALKVGSSAMSMDRTSLAIRPRPDLISAFPDVASLSERAGFTCFFPGSPDLTGSEAPLLKILFEQGPATLHAVDITNVRRLGNSASLDSLLHLYPNIETERFFPSLVDAVRRDYLSHCASLDFADVAVCKQALVVAVPSGRDDCFLVLEEIRHNAVSCLDVETGIIFLAGRQHKHGELAKLVQELRADLPMPCSLVFIPEILAAVYALRDILLTVGANRFCFIAVNDILTQDGWRAANMFLRSNVSRAIAFESVDPDSLLKSEERALSFGCSWDILSRQHSDFRIEIDTQPSAFSLLDSILQVPDDVIQAGAFFTRRTAPGRMARLINLSDTGRSRISAL